LAVAGGDAEIVQLLIEHQARLDYATPSGTTALHVAVQRNQPECLRRLIGAGAAVRLKTDKGKTPLALAKAAGDKDMIEALKKAE